MLFITSVGWWMDCWSCRAWEGGERARAERPVLHASAPAHFPSLDDMPCGLCPLRWAAFTRSSMSPGAASPVTAK